MNNKVSSLSLSLSLLSKPKGGAHWAESCRFSADSQQRGSEALLISEGLSDSAIGGGL